MKIKKMLLLAGMAMAAIAFAAPAVAQAQQTHGLTENSEWLEPGAEVTLTSTDLRTTTFLGTLTCSKVTLHYEVEVNDGTHVVLQPVPASHNGTTEGCDLLTSGGSTHPVHISNAGTKEVTIDTWGKGTASSTFSSLVTFTGGGTASCTFTGGVALEAVKSGSNEVKIGQSGLNGGLCGPGSISGTGKLETPDGTAVVGDFIKTN